MMSIFSIVFLDAKALIMTTYYLENAEVKTFTSPYVWEHHQEKEKIRLYGTTASIAYLLLYLLIKIFHMKLHSWPHPKP